MMNETDRELLELAAKLAGMTIDTHYVDGGASVWTGEPHNSDWIPNWNPFTDDGDAFRMAVKLHLPLEAVIAFVAEREPEWEKDPYAATRRAIVRAAAEIRRSME